MRKLPQRVFNSPLIEYANFKDGSFINMIELSRPYADGSAFAVYSGWTDADQRLFKSYQTAKVWFDKRVMRRSWISPLVKQKQIDHSKPLDPADY